MRLSLISPIDSLESGVNVAKRSGPHRYGVFEGHGLLVACEDEILATGKEAALGERAVEGEFDSVWSVILVLGGVRAVEVLDDEPLVGGEDWRLFAVVAFGNGELASFAVSFIAIRTLTWHLATLVFLLAVIVVGADGPGKGQAFKAQISHTESRSVPSGRRWVVWRRHAEGHHSGLHNCQYARGEEE